MFNVAPRHHTSLLFRAEGGEVEHHGLFDAGVEPHAGPWSSSTPTECPVHGGAAPISFNGGPWWSAWKPHTLRWEKSRFPLLPLLPTSSNSPTAHNFTTKPHPPRSAASRRRFTLASVSADGGMEAQGEEMCAEMELGGGPGGGRIRRGWR
jgi:hypothetical protein